MISLCCALRQSLWSPPCSSKDTHYPIPSVETANRSSCQEKNYKTLILQTQTWYAFLNGYNMCPLIIQRIFYSPILDTITPVGARSLCCIVESPLGPESIHICLCLHAAAAILGPGISDSPSWDWASRAELFHTLHHKRIIACSVTFITDIIQKHFH